MKQKKTRIPLCATVAFSLIEDALCVYMHDSELPQSVVHDDESVSDTACRIFTTHTGISLVSLYLEQLYTFDAHDHLTISYFVLVPHRFAKTAQQGEWVPIETFKKNHSVHEIIQYAYKRLRWKLEYTNIAFSLLPSTFTLTQLQKVYELILKHTFDKRNFRRKILSLGLITATGQTVTQAGRPAQLYRFKTRKPMIVQVL